MHNQVDEPPSILARLPCHRSSVLVSNSHFYEITHLQRQRLNSFAI